MVLLVWELEGLSKLAESNKYEWGINQKTSKYCPISKICDLQKEFSPNPAAKLKSFFSLYRRLYDVSNVLLAISERYPLIAKVRATRVGTQNTTAFQYRGPELETVSIDSDTIFNLPNYRRKHLCFDYGKLLLGIPIRPESIPGLNTVRRNQVDQTQPWPIDTKHGLDLLKVTVADMNKPMTVENVIFMECQKMNYDPKQFSSELVKSLKSRKIKKENPGLAQKTRIESERQIGTKEEVLDKLIVPDVNIHASMMNQKGTFLSEDTDIFVMTPN